MKVLLPVLWISVLCVSTYSLWLGKMHGRNGALPPDEMKWLFLGVGIAGTMFITWTCAGLKRVRVNSRNLYVSNYLREISVPLTMIKDVTDNHWINIHPVTVHFCSVTEFGQKITFMPTNRFFALWRSHPVVAELKQLASLAVSSIPSGGAK